MTQLSYAEKHEIEDTKELALDLVLHSDEFFVVVANKDPEMHCEFLSIAVVDDDRWDHFRTNLAKELSSSELRRFQVDE